MVYAVPSMTDQQMQQFSTYLFDADGVLWKATEPIPGAIEFIGKLMSQKKRVFVVTNNSTKTTTQYVKKLKDLGFGMISEANIVSPNVVLVDYLRKHPQLYKKGIYVIGTTAIKDMIEQGLAGAECHGIGPDPMPEGELFMQSVDVSRPASAVVVGYDAHFSYPKIAKAAYYLKDPDCGFFVTNEDYTFPGLDPNVVIPGTGCVTASIRAAALHRQPLVFGKPSRQLSEYLSSNYDIAPEKTIMFGDRLDTDIKWGNENGYTTCWMTTGVHQQKDVDDAASANIDKALIPDFTYSFADQL